MELEMMLEPIINRDEQKWLRVKNRFYEISGDNNIPDCLYLHGITRMSPRVGKDSLLILASVQHFDNDRYFYRLKK